MRTMKKMINWKTMSIIEVMSPSAIFESNFLTMAIPEFYRSLFPEGLKFFNDFFALASRVHNQTMEAIAEDVVDSNSGDR